MGNYELTHGRTQIMTVGYTKLYQNNLTYFMHNIYQSIHPPTYLLNLSIYLSFFVSFFLSFSYLSNLLYSTPLHSTPLHSTSIYLSIYLSI